MSVETPQLEPGIYDAVADNDYFALPYASKSKLWKLRDRYETLNREEWLAYMNESDEEAYALTFGRFFDDIISSQGNREFIAERYAPYSDHKSACKAYWKAQSEADKVLVLEADWQRAADMCDSIMRHPVAGPLLSGRGFWQTTLVWDEPNTGVRCKGRVDRRTEWTNPITRLPRPCHIDIKTAKSADPAIFNKDARFRGYFLQAAHYLDGTNCATGKERARDFVFLVVEKDPIKSKSVKGRHDVRLFSYSLGDGDPEMEGALRLRDELLREFASLQSPDWKPTTPIHKLHMPWGMEADHEPNERRSA